VSLDGDAGRPGDEFLDAGRRTVDFDTFADVARTLMYRQLLPRRGADAVTYGVVDFSDAKCASGENVVATPEFLRSSKPDWARTRWIEARGGEPALKLLGVKFGLHPLALEDALTVSQRPKAERYGEHLHIVAPVFTVGSAADAACPLIAIHNVSIFVPLRGASTLVTFSSRAAPRHWSARVRAELRKSRVRRSLRRRLPSRSDCGRSG
jgi:Mg2+ and Co2+ transporter CorA